MKEFGKRLLVLMSLPLWLVIHFIFLAFYMYIIFPVGLVVAALTYLITGRELFGDWWVDNFEYSFRKHVDFMEKMEKL